MSFVPCVKPISKHRWPDQLLGESRMNWLYVINGQVFLRISFYLENLYVMGCICLTIKGWNFFQSLPFLIGLPEMPIVSCFNAYSIISQFSSVAQLCPTLCDPRDWSTPGFPVHQQLPELARTHVHRVSDAIQSSHPLSSPSPPAFNLSQHQGLFKWVSSSHQVAKVLEFQLQHQSFQWIFMIDFLYDWLV